MKLAVSKSENQKLRLENQELSHENQQLGIEVKRQADEIEHLRSANKSILIVMLITLIMWCVLYYW